MTDAERDLIDKINASTRQIEALTEAVRLSVPRPIPLSREERRALWTLQILRAWGVIQAPPPPESRTTRR